MKKFLLLCLCVAATLGAWAREHTVQRGETPVSIAKMYNITTDQLFEANPAAASMFYVGLKLNIPETSAAKLSESPKNTETSPVYVSTPTVGQTQTSQPTYPDAKDSNANIEGPGWDFQIQISVGFLKSMEGADNFNYTYGADIAFPYWFQEKRKGVFAAPGIGYNSSNINMRINEYGYRSDIRTTHHLISIPLRAGYTFCTENKNFGVTPYAGFNLGFTVKSKYEMDNKEVDLGDSGCKFVPDFRLGVALRLAGFNCGGYVAFPLTDDAKDCFGTDGHFGVFIGYGF